MVPFAEMNWPEAVAAIVSSLVFGGALVFLLAGEYVADIFRSVFNRRR